MCNLCKDIIIRDNFYSLRDYLACLDYIQELLVSGDYDLIESTCALNEVINENGKWISDYIEHSIQCKKCGQVYTCSAETYHGGGGFRKKC